MIHEIHILTAVRSLANLPPLYDSILGQANAHFIINWWIVFDSKQALSGELWKSRFQKSKNPHLLINCQISEINESPLFHINGLFDALEQQLQLLPEIRDQWVYVLEDHGQVPPLEKHITNGNEHTTLCIVHDNFCHVCFRLKALAGQRFCNPDVTRFSERLWRKAYDASNQTPLEFINSISIKPPTDAINPDHPGIATGQY